MKHPNYELWQIQYNSITPAGISFLLKQLPDSFIKIIGQWINDKVIKSGLNTNEINKITHQFIFEVMIRKLRYTDVIDVRDFLIIIDDLAYCSSKERKEMKEYLHARLSVYEQMTAEGIISCNPGLRQQD